MRTRVWYRGRSDERGEPPGRPPWSSRRMHVRANQPRPARRIRGRRSTAGDRRTDRASSPYLVVPQIRIPSPRPPTAFADARRPARHERESTFSLSREAVDAQLPTPSLIPLLALIPALLFSLCCIFCFGCLLLRNVLSAMVATPPLEVVARTAMFAMHNGHESGLSLFASGLVRFLQVSGQPIERPLPELS